MSSYDLLFTRKFEHCFLIHFPSPTFAVENGNELSYPRDSMRGVRHTYFSNELVTLYRYSYLANSDEYYSFRIGIWKNSYEYVGLFQGSY